MYFKSKCCKSQVMIALVSIFSCVNTYASDTNSEEIHNLLSGNSIKIINRFAESIMYFESDDSFKSFAKQGPLSGGKWRVTRDSMCGTTLPQPYNPPREFCLYLKGRKLGESWSESSETHGEIKRTILKGHPKL